MKQISLNGNICFISGASRGIGRAIAESFLQAGGVVIGTATSDDGADRISHYIKEKGGVGIGLKLDVTQLDSINSVLTVVKKEYGTPTVLVNNAAVTQDNLLVRMKESQWDEVMLTNLTSVYRVTKTFLKGMMQARQGRIINISSVVAHTGNPGQTNYATTKAGLLGFSKSLAREVASRNITVNTIAPGFVDTDMTKSLEHEQKQKMMESIPLGRLGSPDDIANAALYLASPMGSYVTGSTIHVCGGMYMN